MDDFTLCDILIKRIEQQRGEVKKEFDEAVDERFDFMVNEVKGLCGVGPSSFSGPSSLSLVSGSNEARVAPSGDASAIFPPGFSGSLVSGPTEAFSASSSTQNKIFDVITTSATTSSSYSHHFTPTTPKLMSFSADLSSSSSTSFVPSSSSSSCVLGGSDNLTFWPAGSSSSSSIVSSSSVVHSSSYTPSSSMIIYGSSTASSSYGSNSVDYGSSYDYDSNASSYGSYGSAIALQSPSTYPLSSSTMIDHYSNHNDCTYYNLQQMAPLQFKMAANESEFMVKQEELEEDDPDRLQQQFKVEDFDAIFRSIDESSQHVMPRYTGQGRQGTQVFSGKSTSFVQKTTQDFEETDQLQPISSDHELLINEMLEDLNEGEDYFFRNFKDEHKEDESSKFKKRNRESSQEDPNEEEEEDEEGKAKGSKKFTILGYWCDQAKCELNDKKLYVDKVTLNHHLKNSHGIEAHRCCIQGCGKSFINKYKLTKHVSVHGHLNPFTCGFCSSKHFKTYDSLSCHHLKFHEGGLYVCAEDSCTFTSTYRQAMYYHWLSVHEARHVCAFCDRSFVRKSLFDSHMRIHSQVKPYKCIFPGCDTKAGAQYMSRDRSAIVRHIRVRHFGLPRYMKEQIQREIVDTRDPNQFIIRDIN